MQSHRDQKLSRRIVSYGLASALMAFSVGSYAESYQYQSYTMPELPAEISEVNEPIDLVAVRAEPLDCTDPSGEGVEKFLKSGKQPKKYSAGKLTIRQVKPTIKRLLRFRDGSPGHLTVESYKLNCLSTLISTARSDALSVSNAGHSVDSAAVKAAVSEQLDSTTKTLLERIESLEARVQALESQR